MTQTYKEAFLRALDKAYPGWSGEPPSRSSVPARTEDNENKPSAVDLMPGEPDRSTAAESTGRESRQKAPARFAPLVSKMTNSGEMPSQKTFLGIDRSLLSLLHLFRPYWGKILVAFLGIMLEAVLGLMRPWPLKVVIDRVLSHKASRVPLIHHWLDAAPFTNMQIVYGCCAAVLLIAVITGLTGYCYTRLIGSIGQHFVFDLRRELFGHMQRLSLRFHDSQRTGDLTTRLTHDIQSIQDFITNGVVVFCTNTLLLTGMAVLMFWVNWRFALATLAVSPLMFWIV